MTQKNYEHTNLIIQKKVYFPVCFTHIKILEKKLNAEENKKTPQCLFSFFNMKMTPPNTVQYIISIENQSLFIVIFFTDMHHFDSYKFTFLFYFVL